MRIFRYYLLRKNKWDCFYIMSIVFVPLERNFSWKIRLFNACFIIRALHRIFVVDLLFEQEPAEQGAECDKRSGILLQVPELHFLKSHGKHMYWLKHTAAKNRAAKNSLSEFSQNAWKFACTEKRCDRFSNRQLFDIYVLLCCRFLQNNQLATPFPLTRRRLQSSDFTQQFDIRLFLATRWYHWQSQRPRMIISLVTQTTCE